jgi:hypothetical protein
VSYALTISKCVMSVSLEISNGDLVALLAVVIEGKFSAQPRDLDVACSPKVASIARRASDAVAAWQVQELGSQADRYREQWLNFAAHPEQWKVAIAHAKTRFLKLWPNWDDEMRRCAVDDLVAPFVLEGKNRDVFIQEMLKIV